MVENLSNGTPQIKTRGDFQEKNKIEGGIELVGYCVQAESVRKTCFRDPANYYLDISLQENRILPSDINVMYNCMRVVVFVVVDRMETMIPTQLPINDIWN